jgi:hypothetical protein
MGKTILAGAVGAGMTLLFVVLTGAAPKPVDEITAKKIYLVDEEGKQTVALSGLKGGSILLTDFRTRHAMVIQAQRLMILDVLNGFDNAPIRLRLQVDETSKASELLLFDEASHVGAALSGGYKSDPAMLGFGPYQDPVTIFPVTTDTNGPFLNVTSAITAKAFVPAH